MCGDQRDDIIREYITYFVRPVQPLSRLLDTGGMAETALAAYGEPAAAAIEARLLSPDVTTSAIVGGARSLQLMVTNSGVRKPLGPSARRGIDRLAAALLDRLDHAPLSLAETISLALLASDATVRSRARQVAADDVEIRRRGVTGARAIDMVRARAQRSTVGGP